MVSRSSIPSGLSLKKLLNAPDSIGDSFKTYIEGFTDNVKDILANFVHEDGDSDVVDLSKIYSRLDEVTNSMLLSNSLWKMQTCILAR